jgi:glutamate/tyrosine decarboxylase-like PLP-dependent enzyme
VVVTIGTTGLGVVDPLADILELRDAYDFRIHADAAYGGYFGLSSLLGDRTRASYDAMGAVDSIVIDPHKHGLQPYGCGCVLFRDPSVGRFYAHDSPYTYFSSADLHLGEITLECSRPGAAAVALWATQRLLPLTPGGEFAAALQRCRDAALALHGRLAASRRWRMLAPPALDIVAWAPRGGSASEVSARARAVFEAAARRQLHLALLELPAPFLRAHWGDTLRWDRESVTCLRSTLMKPAHLDYVATMAEILEAVADAGVD